MDWSLVRHFKKKEWEPNADLVSSNLIFLLDEIRHIYDKKCIIHCAWAQSGHSKKSYHYRGEAVDFHFEDGDYPSQFDLIQSFEDIGGIGFYGKGVWAHPGFHLDIRPSRLYWTERKGKYIYDLNHVLEDLNAPKTV